eukprot:Nk52_evm19s24 gene=Nk52_evmTU19s24
MSALKSSAGGLFRATWRALKQRLAPSEQQLQEELDSYRVWLLTTYHKIATRQHPNLSILQRQQVMTRLINAPVAAKRDKSISTTTTRASTTCESPQSSMGKGDVGLLPRDVVSSISALTNSSSLGAGSNQHSAGGDVFDMKSSIGDNLDKQVLDLFSSANQMFNRRPDKVLKIGETHKDEREIEKKGDLTESSPLLREIASSNGTNQPHPLADALFLGDQHCVQVRKSSIDHPEAGLGVFACKGSLLEMNHNDNEQKKEEEVQEGEEEEDPVVLQPGQVIGFYPGTVYVPTQLWHLPNFPHVDQDNDYLIGRYDNCVVDGKAPDVWIRYRQREEELARKREERDRMGRIDAGAEAVNQLAFEGSLGRRRVGNESSIGIATQDKDGWDVVVKDEQTHLPKFSSSSPSSSSSSSGGAESVVPAGLFGQNDEEEFNSMIINPFAIGHLINHPPPGGQPNVVLYAYDFKKDIPQELRKFVTNSFYEEPSVFYPYEHLCKTMVCVVTRPVRVGEELFVDYRYNPRVDKAMPDWYCPVDEEQNKRRWG